MKKLLSLLGLLIVALSTFAQTFTVDGLTYSLLSEADKTVQLTSGVNAAGDVVISTSITVPASQVLDATWTTQSGPNWTSSENEAGKTVYKSGTIGDNESTVLRCTFRAKGTIAFMCRYRGENDYDYLTVGGSDASCTRTSYATSLKGTSGTWKMVYVNVSDENEHYVEFCYSKDESQSNSPDCAEVYLTAFEGGEFTVASISNNCTFKNNTAITSMTIPESFTEFTAIPSQMFYGCTALKSFSIPAATSIGSEAFCGCESLEEAIMPKVETIDYYAFRYYQEYVNGSYVTHYCKALKYVDLSSVKSIGSEAFRGCSSISSLRIGSLEQWCSVQLPSSNTSYASPLYQSSQNVDLYIGNSETPATSIEMPSTVTEIPQYAFYRTTITSVSAPAATSIGSEAFYYCTSLTSVSLPAATSIGSSAFSSCTSLTSASLPAATSIGSYAFYDCTSLTSASLPAATSIGYSAFQGCESLEEAIMPKVETIGSSAFSYYYRSYYDEDNNYHYEEYPCKSLKYVDLSSVKSIGSEAFRYCSGITSLRIGSLEQWCGVQLEGSDAYYASPLYNSSQKVDLYIGDSDTPATSIEVPSAVTEIPQYAFYRTTITSVTAPAATSIGSSAFNNCTSLTSASLPAATSIGSSAFESCTSLTSASLPAATSIGNSAFYYCTSLTSASLPAATSIGDYAFYYCTSLTSASLPAATSIGDYAFSRCESLPSIELPSAVSIGNGAFYVDYDSNRGYYPTALTSVSLPAATSIGSSVFYYCSKLKSLSIPKVETIGSQAFYETSIDTLRIGSVEQYCSIEYENTNVNNYNYTEQFPFQNDHNNCIFIGDSDTPVTEITIPETTKKIADYAFRGTGIHTVHFEGTNPPALAYTRSFPEWTMLAAPEEAYETYLAADVYKYIPLRITIDGHLDQDVEVTAANGTSNLLEKIGEDEVNPTFTI